MSETKKDMEEIAVVLKRFGDEQSTLLDEYEILSFEVQLNQAILGRSLSELGIGGSRFRSPPDNEVAPPPLVTTQVKLGRLRRRCRGRLDKLFKKLLKPIRKTNGGGGGGNGTGVKKQVAADPNDLKNWKAFSRSLRI